MWTPTVGARSPTRTLPDCGPSYRSTRSSSQVSWGGPDGYAGLEFPLLHVLTALVWRAVGVSDVAGRLVAVAFSLASVWLIYLLGRRLFNVAVGRGAAFLLAFSPSFVCFGAHVSCPTSPWSPSRLPRCWATQPTFRPTGQRDVVLGAICLALAGLVKVPAILILWPHHLARMARTPEAVVPRRQSS